MAAKQKTDMIFETEHAGSDSLTTLGRINFFTPHLLPVEKLSYRRDRLSNLRNNM
jgi:hypothetical protein